MDDGSKTHSFSPGLGMQELYTLPLGIQKDPRECMGLEIKIRFLSGLDADLLRSGGFCLGQSQRQHAVGDLRFDMIRVDDGGQA